MSHDLNQPGDLVPLTADKLERDIRIHLACMRVRKEPGRMPDNPFFAPTLAQRLLRRNLLAFKRREQIATAGD
jgi:hypothetical protein